MSDTGVCVVARMKAKEGKESELQEALCALVEPTRQETECMEYLLHRSEDDARLFVFYEQWTSREALDRHLKMPHLAAFLARADELLEGPPEITTLDLLV